MGAHNRLFYGPTHTKHGKNNNVDEFIMLQHLFSIFPRADPTEFNKLWRIRM